MRIDKKHKKETHYNEPERLQDEKKDKQNEERKRLLKQEEKNKTK